MARGGVKYSIMMTIIRTLIGLAAIIVLITVAFGQTTPNTQLSDQALQQLLQQNTLLAPSSLDTEPLAAPQPVSQQPIVAPIPQDLAQPAEPQQSVSIPVDALPRTASTTIDPLSDAEFESLLDEVTASIPQLVSATNVQKEELISAPNLRPVLKDQSRLDGFGVLNIDNGGFRADVWNNTRAQQVVPLLERLADKPLQDAAARNLLRRLLVTQAQPPQGAQNWLALRLKVLQAHHMAEAMQALLMGVNPVLLQQNPSLNRYWVASNLLVGETNTACDFVTGYVLNSDDPFWREAVLVCQGIKKQLGPLQLGLSANQATPLPVLTRDLLQTIAADDLESPRLPPEAKLSFLQAALYAAHPHLLTPAVIPLLPDLVMRRVAAATTLPLSMRLQAAEQLVAREGLPTDRSLLLSLYRSVAIDPAALQDPVAAAAKQMDGSMARGVLWQAAGEMTEMSTSRALALQALWQRAYQDGLPELAEQLTPAVAGLRPQPSLAWLAPAALNLQLRRGELEEASDWWEMFSDQPALAQSLQQQRAELAARWALVAPVAAPLLLDWAETRDPNAPMDLGTQRLLAVLEASDVTVPAEVWLTLGEVLDDTYVAQPAGPGPLWLKQVMTALEQLQTGWAVLLAVAPLQHGPAAQINPTGAANIISALRYLSLNEDARVMALRMSVAQ